VNIIQENEHLKEKLEQSENERRLIMDESKKDALTRAYNRACFNSDIEKFIQSGYKNTISLAFIDGDKFKSINDTYGHQAGDTVLKALVDRMFVHTRKLQKARVYRYGGEEFLILLINENRKTVLDFLNELRKDIMNSPVQHDNTSIPVTVSIGVAFCETDDTIATLVGRADQAVYKAKNNGRNRIEIGEQVAVISFQEDKEMKSEGKLSMGFVL